MHSQIIPGVLEKSWGEIEKRLENIKRFASAAHIDIIDGNFVDNTTFLDPAPFEKYAKDIFLEVHMMVIDPASFIEAFAAAGFKRFIGHVEHMASQTEFVSIAKKHGEVGLALDGPTHISAIKTPFEDLDTILVYTSGRVGFSGPPLLEERLDKIRHLRRLTNIPIEADGGINDKTITQARNAGATRFVSTGFLFGSDNPSQKFTDLKRIIETS